jgi:hypothetical protein
MRLTDHVTLNFNNKISTAAVFLAIEKAFYTTWHSDMLNKLSKLEFSASLFKLIGSYLSQRKFRVSVEGVIPTPMEMQAGVPQGSILSPPVFNMYKNDAPSLTLPSLQMTLVCTRQIERRVLLLENSSTVSAQWRPHVSTRIPKSMRTRGIYISRSPRPLKSHLTLNGRDIPFVNSVKYLDLIFDKKG